MSITSCIQNIQCASVRYRQLGKADLPALEWGGQYKHFRRLYADIFKAMCQGKSLMWVAELKTVGVIGQLFVQLSGGRKELVDGITRSYIFSFRIKNAYRQLGLGSNFLKVVEAELVKRRYIWVTLNVGRNNPSARRFYERHRYRVVAAEPGRWSYLDDQGKRRHVHEPSWRMQKRLKSDVKKM